MLGSQDYHTVGFLSLVDLAGSERLGKSASTGDRLKETKVGIEDF